MSCAATLEVALRQRLDGVAGVSISEIHQTTEVRLRPGVDPFSPRVFREAHRQAQVEIVAMRIDACGSVESGASGRRLRAGATELLLAGEHAPLEDGRVCVSGTLREEGDRLRLEVTSSSPAPAPAG
jgi:hypothetical protein